MNVLKPHLQTTVFTLLAAGKSQHEIARITKVDRKTIRVLEQRFVIEQANSPGVTTGAGSQIPPPRPPGQNRQSLSACEPHREFIQAQLRLHRNSTAIYQDLVDQFGFKASYSSVKRFAGTLVAQDPAQFDRLEFAPGEEVQVDYGEGAPTRVPGSDRYRKPRLFVMTLRYSRRCFRRVVWQSSQQVWAQLHEQAWRYFGGTASYVVLDNLKEGVIKPDLYEPALNPVYAAVLDHYGVVADPARVRDPNRKGSVENAIQHTQSTALKGRRFETIEAQNAFTVAPDARSRPCSRKSVQHSNHCHCKACVTSPNAAVPSATIPACGSITAAMRRGLRASAAAYWFVCLSIISKSVIRRATSCYAPTPAPHDRAAWSCPMMNVPSTRPARPTAS